MSFGVISRGHCACRCAVPRVLSLKREDLSAEQRAAARRRGHSWLKARSRVVDHYTGRRRGCTSRDTNSIGLTRAQENSGLLPTVVAMLWPSLFPMRIHTLQLISMALPTLAVKLHIDKRRMNVGTRIEWSGQKPCTTRLLPRPSAPWCPLPSAPLWICM